MDQFLQLVGAVDVGGLIDVLGYVLQGSHPIDHVLAEDLPDRDQDDGDQRGIAVTEQVDGRVYPSAIG